MPLLDSIRFFSNRIATIIANAHQKKFTLGLVWNFVSLFFIGFGGFLINVIIGRVYGPEVLGVFNQVLAFYLVAAQASVGGFAFSTLHFAAYNAEKPSEFSNIALIGAILTAGTSSLVGVLCFLSADAVGFILKSPDVAKGIYWICPGLIFFSLNKVLFSAINGRQNMIVYAAGQASRYILFLLALLLLISIEAPSTTLPFLFTISEFTIMVALTIYLVATSRRPSSLFVSTWWRKHIHFGVKAWLIGFLMDVNTKVDVLMLGYFAGDGVVGIYAFALLFVEALSQVVVVVQNNINPLLARFNRTSRCAETRAMIKTCLKLFTPVMLVVSSFILVAYPMVTEILKMDPLFLQSRLYFAFIATGMILSSAYLPFTMVLNQYGKPNWFTLFMASSVTVNLILNFALIPYLGPSGAAIATGTSFIIQVPLLKFFVYRATGDRI